MTDLKKISDYRKVFIVSVIGIFLLFGGYIGGYIDSSLSLKQCVKAYNSCIDVVNELNPYYNVLVPNNTLHKINITWERFNATG